MIKCSTGSSICCGTIATISRAAAAVMVVACVEHHRRGRRRRQRTAAAVTGSPASPTRPRPTSATVRQQ
uniref:Putative secreted protein n=1 Tax=Anopheles darlingi TaxID=43151 RepID=A0A2M4DJN7_ANODA